MTSISKKRAERIARNINAMDVNYHYTDDGRVFNFWNNLDNKLRAILNSLNDSDKKIVTSLCEARGRKYFGLA